MDLTLKGVSCQRSQAILVSGTSHGINVELAHPYCRVQRGRFVIARGLKKGVATLCIGGGEATALALELV